MWVMFQASVMSLLTPVGIIWGLTRDFTASARGTKVWIWFMFGWQICAVALFWAAAYV